MLLPAVMPAIGKAQVDEFRPIFNPPPLDPGPRPLK